MLTGHITLLMSSYDGQKGSLSYTRREGMTCTESFTGNGHERKPSSLSTPPVNTYKLSPQASSLSMSVDSLPLSSPSIGELCDEIW